jgi:hypothetical protein
MHICVIVSVSVCMSTHLLVRLCMHIRMCVCIFAFIYVYKCACACITKKYCYLMLAAVLLQCNNFACVSFVCLFAHQSLVLSFVCQHVTIKITFFAHVCLRICVYHPQHQYTSIKVSYNIVQHMINVMKGFHQCCFNVVFLEAGKTQQFS